VATSNAASLRALFGEPDDVKFVSSATLFALADGTDANVFLTALERWNGGALDPRTLALLNG